MEIAGCRKARFVDRPEPLHAQLQLLDLSSFPPRTWHTFAYKTPPTLTLFPHPVGNENCALQNILKARTQLCQTFLILTFTRDAIIKVTSNLLELQNSLTVLNKIDLLLDKIKLINLYILKL